MCFNFYRLMWKSLWFCKRAYRIINNSRQQDIDNYSVIGASIGIALNAIVFKGGMFFPSLSAGVLCGMAAYIIDPKKLTEEFEKHKDDLAIAKLQDILRFGTETRKWISIHLNLFIFLFMYSFVPSFHMYATLLLLD